MLDSEETKKEEESLSSGYSIFKQKSLDIKIVIIVIVLSLIFGGVSGFFGAWYFPTTSWGQKYFYPSSLTPIKKKIALSEESAIIDVVKKASPAVVSIVITKDLSKLSQFGFDPFGGDDFFFPFFGLPQQPKNTEPNFQQVGAGSGFFVSSDGLILTNKHVISDEQASYTVITYEGKQYEAKVLATDPRNDLAIVKIEIQNAPYLQLADSSQIQIGQRVVAIGNSLGQYQNTVTSGIVSGIGRSVTAGSSDGAEQLEGVIQTDAAINPGNSGGPLLNTASQVVGINTAIDRQGQLVGFAIPSNDANKALKSFEKYKKIVRPFLGVRYIMIDKTLAQRQKLPKDYGALVVRGDKITDFAVIPGSPADKAGLMENDIILEFNGNKIENENSLSRFLRDKEVGDIVTLKIYHKGEEKTVKVTLEENK